MSGRRFSVNGVLLMFFSFLTRFHSGVSLTSQVFPLFDVSIHVRMLVFLAIACLSISGSEHTVVYSSVDFFPLADGG
jgi:hypothetical protein